MLVLIAFNILIVVNIITLIAFLIVYAKLRKQRTICANLKGYAPHRSKSRKTTDNTPEGVLEEAFTLYRDWSGDADLAKVGGYLSCHGLMGIYRTRGFARFSDWVQSLGPWEIEKYGAGKPTVMRRRKQVES